MVDELHRLFEAVDAPNDLEFQTWLSLHDLTVGHGPDLVIELGRGYGNSTVVFTDAARSRRKLQVVSIGYEGHADHHEVGRAQCSSSFKGDAASLARSRTR